MSTTDFDTKLLAFAEGLGPSDDYIKRGNLALEKVIETLKTQQLRYGIARVCISGSIGKHTALKDSDFDAVLFINYINPCNYRDILEYFENILKPRIQRLKLSKMEVKGKYSLQFVLEDEFEVDLLVATNCAMNQGDIESHGVFLTQQIQTLRRIARNPSDFYDYSSSLAESQTQFMRQQDSFTHSLVRLCKFWLKKLKVGFYRSGVKSCIELIAVFSAKQRPSGDNSISRAFKAFLENIQRIDSLKISFGSRKRTQLPELSQLSTFVKIVGARAIQVSPGPSSSTSLDYSNVPWNIRQKGHFIMDPANPYNDLSMDIKPEFSKKIKKFADLVIHNWDLWPNYSSTEAFFIACAKFVV